MDPERGFFPEQDAAPAEAKRPYVEVGHRASEVLGDEYVADLSRKHRQVIEQHNRDPRVRAAKLAMRRSILGK